MTIKNHVSSFMVSRLNSSTYAITEDDRFGEHPVLYAKLYPDQPVMVLSDTGLNSPHKRSQDARYTEIRKFLEECPISANDNQPLNPGGRKQYIIIITHCHYDHIYGLPSFYEQGNAAAPPIIVSSLTGKDFVRDDIYTHSLARFRELPPIEFKPTLFAKDGESLVVKADGASLVNDIDLGITIFNTPGHCPDETAWYDRAEHHLFVGDSVYETGNEHGFVGIYPGPIIFPKEGNWIDYMESMERLLTFVKTTNISLTKDGREKVKLGAAHNTMNVDAEEALEDVLVFFHRVVRHEVPVVLTEEQRGETYCRWDDGGRFGVGSPLRLCEEYRHAHSANSAALPSPCGLYVASLTQQNLYIQYANSLLPAFTFPLDDPSQPKIIAENQSIQWFGQSTFLMLVSTQGVHAYALQDSSVNVHVSNGSGGLGKIHAAEVLADSGREQLMVAWEFGRVNLWDMSTGRATEIGDLKMGGKGSPWAIRRQKGRPEVLALLMRRDAQDVLSFYLPPNLAPLRSVTLSTIDAQAISWSSCGRWLSVLDSALNARPLQIFTPDGFLYRRYPSQVTPPSTPNEETPPSLGFNANAWSSSHLALATTTDITLLSSRTFSNSSALSLTTVHTSQRSLEDSIVAYQEVVNAAGQRSYDHLTGQLIPLPNAKTSITDMRFNSSGGYLSCRDECNDMGIYIIDAVRRRVHTLLIQHTAVRRAIWHPYRPSFMLVLTEDGTVHIWDVESSQPPVHVPHSFETVADKGRVEARWISSATQTTDTSHQKDDTDEIIEMRDKLAILLTTRKAGFQLLWPEGRPAPSPDALRASVAITRGPVDDDEEGERSHDSLYDILTGRTPLPELKVKQFEAEVDQEETVKLDDTFREKVQSSKDEKTTPDGLMGASLEDDSEIF